MGATLTWEANAMTVSRDMKTPLTGVDVDCGEIPDAAMTLAVSIGAAQLRLSGVVVVGWGGVELRTVPMPAQSLTDFHSFQL